MNIEVPTGAAPDPAPQTPVPSESAEPSAETPAADDSPLAGIAALTDRLAQVEQLERLHAKLKEQLKAAL